MPCIKIIIFIDYMIYKYYQNKKRLSLLPIIDCILLIAQVFYDDVKIMKWKRKH